MSMTWLELSKLPEGTRVKFTHEHDIFPDALVRAGVVCTLVENSLNEKEPAALLLPDNADLRDQLKEWDGLIYLAPHGADFDDDCGIEQEGK